MGAWACLTKAWTRGEKSAFSGVFVKKTSLWSSLGITQKSNFSATIPSAMNGLLQ